MISTLHWELGGPMLKVARALILKIDSEPLTDNIIRILGTSRSVSRIVRLWTTVDPQITKLQSQARETGVAAFSSNSMPKKPRKLSRAWMRVSIISRFTMWELTQLAVKEWIHLKDRIWTGKVSVKVRWAAWKVNKWVSSAKTISARSMERASSTEKQKYWGLPHPSTGLNYTHNGKVSKQWVKIWKKSAGNTTSKLGTKWGESKSRQVSSA